MKPYITIILVIMLMLSTTAIAFPINTSSNQTQNPSSRGTHFALGEYATTTTCSYCKYAHGALKNLYMGDWHDFYYVTLVSNKNIHANNRKNDFNLYGTPTVYWDGGYDVDVGAGSIPGAMNTYNISIPQSTARIVKDVDITLNVVWQGNAVMNINVSIANDETTPYTGRLRVYVTEVCSTLDWKDTYNLPYTFTFLDYAFNQDVTIGNGLTWQDEVVWDGHNYNSGMGQNFGSIQYGNIMVIAALFNPTWHQGYSYPPSSNPFDAYWIDDCTGFRVGTNSPPFTPNTPVPNNAAVNVNINSLLRWNGGDPNQWNPEDTVTYDIYFGTSSSPPMVSHNYSDTTYNPGTLELETTYYWKIVSWDDHGVSTEGPLWSYTTRGNDPPNNPMNPIPADEATNVNVQSDISWDGGDPDSDPVTYDVYFGTATDPPLVSANHSGTMYPLEELIYNTTYYWRIVAWDPFDEKAEGTIWQFTTSNEPNVKPNDPIIDGKTNIRIRQEYDFEFSAIDPNDDQVLFWVEWGDGSTSGWQGPVDSGEVLILTHSWDTKGSHTIRAQAKDIYGSASDWTTKPISVIRAKSYLLIQNRILFGLFPMVENEVIAYWHGSRQQVLTSQFDGYIGNIFMVGVLTI